MQASLNSVLMPIQSATCTNVGAAVVKTPAIPPGQQLQVTTFGMSESPPEQSVQTMQEPMHTDTSMEVATGTNVGVSAMNTNAILPGHQLLGQTAAYVAPESPAEQPVQTRQEPMHTGMSAAPKHPPPPLPPHDQAMAGEHSQTAFHGMQYKATFICSPQI